MPALHRRKLETIADFAEYRTQQLKNGPFELFQRRARFTGPKEILLDGGTRLTADKFIVAVGSQVNVPPVPGLDQISTWTSDDVLELDFVPDEVMVQYIDPVVHMQHMTYYLREDD